MLTGMQAIARSRTGNGSLVFVLSVVVVAFAGILEIVAAGTRSEIEIEAHPRTVAVIALDGHDDWKVVAFGESGGGDEKVALRFETEDRRVGSVSSDGRYLLFADRRDLVFRIELINSNAAILCDDEFELGREFSKDPSLVGAGNDSGMVVLVVLVIMRVFSRGGDADAQDDQGKNAGGFDVFFHGCSCCGLDLVWTVVGANFFKVALRANGVAG